MTPSCQWFSTADGSAYSWRQQAVIAEGVTVHLNLLGSARLQWQDSGPLMHLEAGDLLWLRGRPDRLDGRRLQTEAEHECLSLYFPDVWLRSILSGSETVITPALAPLLLASSSHTMSHRRRLSMSDDEWARATAAMQASDPAQQLLQSARLMEFLMREVFGEVNAEVRQTRSDRLGRERVQRVKKVLLERLENPPDLRELADLAGCTASYLSRTFTRTEGMTLSLWLRHARIEKAASLIASGVCNVSEAALQVGYRSISHFSRAFHAEKGTPPSRYVQHLAGGGLSARLV